MRHMRSNEMACSKRGVQAQLTSQHRGGDDAGELSGVVTWVGGVWAAHTEEVEHSGLGLEDRAAANGADFDGGHGDGDVEVAVVAGGFVNLSYL